MGMQSRLAPAALAHDDLLQQFHGLRSCKMQRLVLSVSAGVSHV